MINIVVLDGHVINPGDLSWDPLNSLGQTEVYDRTPPSEVIKRLKGVTAAFTNKSHITSEVLKQCPELKYIGVLATGYDVVDIKAARESGVIVTNVPSYGTYSVAQFALALLLEICHHIGHHDQAVHEGRWEKQADWCFWDYPMLELAGQTLGIVGFGRIGQTLGLAAAALGMRIIANQEHRSKSGSCAEYLPLSELWGQADIISLNCPLKPETKEIINSKTISLMKDGVILINTSRGGLIVEKDLAEALNSGKVAGAALDVVSVEPITQDNPLLSAKNCIITPHVAGAPKAARGRILLTAADNLKSFLAGNPVNVVKG